MPATISGLRPILSDQAPVAICAAGPDRGVDGGDEPDLCDACAVCGEEQRYEPPGQRVVEVVDQPGLGAGAQRRHPVAGARERVAQLGRLAVRGGVVALLERDVCGGVAHEQHGEQQRGHGDRGAGDDDDVARRELRGEQPAEPGGERDPAVAGGLVEPER